MIYEKIMFACKCDTCGKVWEDDHTGFVAFTDKLSMENNIVDDTSWHTDGDKHYCPDCYDDQI